MLKTNQNLFQKTLNLFSTRRSEILIIRREISTSQSFVDTPHWHLSKYKMSLPKGERHSVLDM